jgi:endo-1,4-beta-D-glucanase Y
MPNSKSAPFVATILLGIASSSGLGACSGFLVTPGAGAAGNNGSAGVTGAAGTGAANTSGTAGTASGMAGRGGTGVLGSAGSTGVAGTTAGRGGTMGSVGVAGAGVAGNGIAGTGAANTGGTAGGSTGAAGTAPLRGPTPAMPGLAFPFPQNRPMQGCGFPTNYLNADVTAAYTQWKNETVTSNGAPQGAVRVQRLASDPVNAGTPLNSTVSEGIAYGMMIAVYMGDKALFDGLWAYEKAHRNGNGLMDWSISASGQVIGIGAATDADEDMAFALIMADRQWGGYMNDALFQVNAVWNNEIHESKLVKNGDGWGDWNNLNISYFAPAYYRLFKQIDTNADHKWDDVIKTVYDTIAASLKPENGNMTNGLVPAWCTSTGSAVSAAPGSSQPFHYQYDSCRTPFRIGLDWCWFGEMRARDYVAKTSSFFAGLGAANIVDGYELNGNKRVQFSPANGTPTLAQQSAAFIGPAAVGAMSNGPMYQQFLNDAYARLATRQMLVGGAYYDHSWNVMSLLMLTGNFLNYRAINPYNPGP